MLKYPESFGKMVWSAIIELFGIFRKNGPGFERSRYVFQIKSRGITILVKSWPIFREFGDARSYEPWPIVTTSGVWPNALGEISSALLARRMFSSRSRFRLRLQPLRMWMDLLRPTARGSVLTLLRPPLTLWRDLLATSPAISASRDLC